jgi:hypothetical protein
MGGWAKNSCVKEGKYIDPTMTTSVAAWQYFGWLVPAKPLHQDQAAQNLRFFRLAKRALG